MQAVCFNPIQMHILNMASHIKSNDALKLLKQQLADFYARLVDEEMDELWFSGQWNEEKQASIKGAHFRTAYK